MRGLDVRETGMSAKAEGDSKYAVVKPFAKAAAREKYAAEVVHAAGDYAISIRNAHVLTLHWFTPRGDPDVFFWVTPSSVDIPVLVLTLALEDGSLQYVQGLHSETNTFIRTTRPKPHFDDLAVHLNGAPVVYRWGSENRYEPLDNRSFGQTDKSAGPHGH